MTTDNTAEEAADNERLIERLTEILSSIADLVHRGPAPMLVRHDWSDLPVRVTVMIAEGDAFRDLAGQLVAERSELVARAEKSDAAQATAVHLLDLSRHASVRLIADLVTVTRKRDEALGLLADECARHYAAGFNERRTLLDSIPMLLWCPKCNARHVDLGEFAEKPHHTHACQECGMVWRPAVEPTVGVDFLPGFRDAE